MASDDMALAVASIQLSTLAQPPAIDTRSRLERLPRELRDQIYGYLLDGEAVKYTPSSHEAATHSDVYRHCNGRAHTYIFHTNLLRANKTLGREAADYLFKYNTFVLVQFEMPEFHLMLHMMDVPIIADHSTKHFSGYSLKVNLRWRSPPCVPLRKEQREAAPVVNKGSLLMLMQDFARLCRMMKFMCSYTRPDAVCIGTQRGVAVAPQFAQPTNKLILVVGVNGSPDTKLSSIQQSQVLDTLQTITGGGYKLHLVGFGDASRVEAVKISMAPRLVWMRALEWDRLDSAWEWKREADALAIKNDIQGARARYSYILDYLTGSMSRFNSAGLYDDDDRMAAGARYAYSMFDLLLSRSALNLRKGYNLNDAQREIETAGQIAVSARVPNSMKKHVAHLDLMLFLTRHHSFLFASVWKEAERRMTTLRELTTQDDHHDHDLDILQEALDEIEQSRLSPGSPELVARMKSLTVPSVFGRLSIRTLPFRAFDSQPVCGMSTRPAGLIGWQDLEHLAELSQKEKGWIQKSQRKNNIEVSSFS